MTALGPALTHPAAVAKAAAEQLKDLDIMARRAMSASAATISVGTWSLRTSSVNSKSVAIACVEAHSY